MLAFISIVNFILAYSFFPFPRNRIFEPRAKFFPHLSYLLKRSKHEDSLEMNEHVSTCIPLISYISCITGVQSRGFLCRLYFLFRITVVISCCFAFRDKMGYFIVDMQASPYDQKLLRKEFNQLKTQMSLVMEILNAVLRKQNNHHP